MVLMNYFQCFGSSPPGALWLCLPKFQVVSQVPSHVPTVEPSLGPKVMEPLYPRKNTILIQVFVSFDGDEYDMCVLLWAAFVGFVDLAGTGEVVDNTVVVWVVTSGRHEEGV